MQRSPRGVGVRAQVKMKNKAIVPLKLRQPWTFGSETQQQQVGQRTRVTLEKIHTRKTHPWDIHRKSKGISDVFRVSLFFCHHPLFNQQTKINGGQTTVSHHLTGPSRSVRPQEELHQKSSGSSENNSPMYVHTQEETRFCIRLNENAPLGMPPAKTNWDERPDFSPLRLEVFFTYFFYVFKRPLRF